MGGKRIRSLKVRVGYKCCISRRARLSSEGIPAGGVRGGSHSGSPKKAGRAVPGARVAKSYESRKGE